MSNLIIDQEQANQQAKQQINEATLEQAINYAVSGKTGESRTITISNNQILASSETEEAKKEKETAQLVAFAIIAIGIATATWIIGDTIVSIIEIITALFA